MYAQTRTSYSKQLFKISVLVLKHIKGHMLLHNNCKNYFLMLSFDLQESASVHEVRPRSVGAASRGDRA